MAEGFGMYTKGIKNKKEAVRLMRKEAEDEYKLDPKSWEDYYSFDIEKIDMISVVETRYYQHRNKKCEGETIGEDSICYHCGENIESNGRKCFAFFAEI